MTALTDLLNTELSVRAYNCLARAGGKIWNGCRKRDNGVPQEYKQRWVKYL